MGNNTNASMRKHNFLSTWHSDCTVSSPSEGNILRYIGGKWVAINFADALVYKGVIDCSANPNYPAADSGHVYKVSVAGKIGGASGEAVGVGDMMICNTDGTPAGDEATVGSYWDILQANIDFATDAECVTGVLTTKIVSPAGLTARLAAPGTIGDTTPATSIKTTILYADHIAEVTGSHNIVFDNNIEVGATTAGKNLTIYATLGTNLVDFTPAGWNEDGVKWTMGATGPLAHTNSDTTAVTATLGAAIVAGTTYQVTIVGTGGGGTATYTLGGVPGTTIAASGAIAITDYITALTTGSLIITPASACTVSITSVSVKALTDATGDVTVDGNITARSYFLGKAGKMYFGQAASTGNYIRFGENGNFAFGSLNNEYILGYANGTFDVVSLRIGSTDTILVRDAAATLAQRNSTNQQIFRLYNTYTDGSNYERLILTGVQGASVNLTAETNGTGADNLDIVLTPAGTGTLKPASDITIADSKNIIWDVAPASDGGFSGEQESVTAGATVALRDVLYEGADGEWYLADADASATMPALRMAVGAGTDGNPVNTITKGVVRNDSWTWTPGLPIYVSTTGTTTNTLTQTAPSGDLDVIQIVGYALSATIMYFNPSPITYEVHASVADTTLSGTPKVFIVYDDDGATPYYFKAYPTKV